jgi:hypothetical protein
MKAAAATLLICLFLAASLVDVDAGQRVLASCFTDRIGNRDNNLYDGGSYYAELSRNPRRRDYSALGKLPNGHRLRITYKGRSIIASKGDVGAGGPRLPKIDLHVEAAKRLGIARCSNFLDYVDIENA